MPPKTRGEPIAAKDLVMAKMTGFPAWPSFVMPQESIPPAILKAKKKTTEFCVIFIPDGDFYWMSSKNLVPLSEEDLDKKLAKFPNKPAKKTKTGRTNTVAEALHAAKGLEFDTFMGRLSKVLSGEPAEPEHTNTDAEPEEVEQPEEAEEPKAEPEAESPPKEEKPKRARKAAATNGSRKQVKAEQPITPPKSVASGASHPKKTEVSPEVLNDEDKQHQLWLCRIKLQRSLIQRNQPVTPEDPSKFPQPTADELSVARLILHRLVDFPVTVELLKQTKIHKVLKCILRDEALEYADSFKLHEKCEELLGKWAQLIEAIKVEKSTKLLNSSSKDANGASDRAGEESEISALEKSETTATEPLKFGEIHD